MAMSEKKRTLVVIATVAVLLITGAYALVYFFDDEYQGDPYTQEDIDNAWESAVTVKTIMNLTEKLPDGSPGTPTVVELGFFGTGSVIDHEGSKVLTNAHVIALYDGEIVKVNGKEYDTDDYDVEVISITCNFYYGSPTSHAQAYKIGGYAMNLIHYDFSVDLALLEFTADVPDVTPLALGDSASVKKDQPVFTIGNSLGEGLKLSEGIVSSKSRSVSWIPGYTISAIVSDLEIYHGNSGGPLITVGGVLIGVTSAGYTTDEDAPSPVTYSVPSNTVKTFLSSIPSETDVIVGALYSCTEWSYAPAVC